MRTQTKSQSLDTIQGAIFSGHEVLVRHNLHISQVRSVADITDVVPIVCLSTGGRPCDIRSGIVRSFGIFRRWIDLSVWSLSVWILSVWTLSVWTLSVWTLNTVCPDNVCPPVCLEHFFRTLSVWTLSVWILSTVCLKQPCLSRPRPKIANRHVRDSSFEVAHKKRISVPQCPRCDQNPRLGRHCRFRHRTLMYWRYPKMN